MKDRIKIEYVHFMPSLLEEGILYVSEEYGIAIHLCACGCGAKVRTPLGETDWTFEETEKGPSLHPSIGNWQLKCKSHYVIENGEIHWAPQWSPEEISIGRERDKRLSEEYYRRMYLNQNIFRKILNWVKDLLS